MHAIASRTTRHWSTAMRTKEHAATFEQRIEAASRRAERDARYML